MAKQAKILDYRKIPSSDPKRMGKYDRMFVVEPEAGVRLVIKVPDEDFTDAKLVDAIRAELVERGTQVNRSIEI